MAAAQQAGKFKDEIVPLATKMKVVNKETKEESIVDYVVDRDECNRPDTTIEGLRKLEYRGYDSAGLALINDAGLQRLRAVGRVAELAAQVDETVPPARPAFRTRAGQRTASRANATRIRTFPAAWPSCTTASSRITKSCARGCAPRAMFSIRTPIPKSSRT